MESAEQAQVHITHIIYALVDRTNVVTITTTGSNLLLGFRVEVDPSDIGKLIGKSGRTARAIRVIMSEIGMRLGLHITVYIVE
jgi:hypothetical protein